MTEVSAVDQAHKRKVSDGAPLGADTTSKRHKGDDGTASDSASLAATDGSADDDEESGEDVDVDSASDTPTANPAHMLDGPGPYVFFCWADGILYTLEGTDQAVYLTLKAAALEAWGHVAHLPKDDVYEALGDHIDVVQKWYVTVPEGAADTPAAKALMEQWDTKSRDGDEDDEQEGDDEDSKAGWWYEVEAQREKPEGDGPALQVELEGEGAWWWTGFRSADLEGRRAMSALLDYLGLDD